VAFAAGVAIGIVSGRWTVGLCVYNITLESVYSIL
jgi:hypothetical protein